MRSMPCPSASPLLLVLLLAAVISGFPATCSRADDAAQATADLQILVDLFKSYETAMNEKDPPKAREAAARLFEKEPAPWVQVLVARACAAAGDHDEACRELSAAIDAIAVDPTRVDPMVIHLSEELEAGDDWEPLRADPRFPALLARARAGTWKPEALEFDGAPSERPPRAPRKQIDAEALRTLREAYDLDAVIAGATDDLDRVRRMCRWVHGRTSHQGWDEALPGDALGLLEVAEKGAQWRCVEYGIVVSECLAAVGIPARTVGGRARDVETIAFGAGHVFAEAWLDDLSRWVFIDPQEDIVGVDGDGTPMNSVEFRNSLASPDPPITYPPGLTLCLHFFTTSFGTADGSRSSVMLGPVGSSMPTKFQRRPTAAPDLFTHRLADFYAPPAP